MANPLNSVQDVQPIEGLRFYVRSRRDWNKAHLVDLSEYRGNGQCACQNFEFRMKGLLEKGAYPAENLQCYHINRALKWLAMELVPKLSASMSQPTTDKSIG